MKKLLKFVFLCGLCNAVKIHIVGVSNEDTKYTAMIDSADTSNSDQSASKISQISGSHEEGNDHDDVAILILWDEKTKYMPIDIFIHFPNIETFHAILPHQKMDSPVNGHFINAANLLKIFITNQKFRKMGSHIFEGCTSIKWIFLEQNQIESIDEATFRGLRTLMKLSLQSNLIKLLPNEAFAPLHDLEFLDLQDNLLSTLPPDVFSTNKVLRTILLAGNRLLYIEPMNFGADSHDEIDLTGNLCLRENFYDAEDFNKAVAKHCKINKSPSDVVEDFKNMTLNPLSCDISDKDKILQLKENIKFAEMEIKKIDEEIEKLNEILFATSSLEVCFTSQF